MTTTSTLLFILITASAIYSLFVYFFKTTKRKKENLFLRLSKEGTENSLIFCSQEILQNKVLGIDGIHRKIMILEKKKDAYYSSIISLDEVHDCQVVNNSDLINRNNLKKSRSESRPANLELRFDLNNHTQSVSIIFSNGIINSKKEFAFLKAKAEYWCVMFSKMLNRQIEARA